MLPTKFQINLFLGSGEEAKVSGYLAFGLSVQEKMQKIDFQDGNHLRFPIETFFAIFDLQVTPMLST